jgi:hypothetical protein
LKQPNTILEQCGLPLQLLRNINIVNCHYYRHRNAPHDAIVVVAFVRALLQLDAAMGIENLTITTFYISCSGMPTLGEADFLNSISGMKN